MAPYVLEAQFVLAGAGIELRPRVQPRLGAGAGDAVGELNAGTRSAFPAGVGVSAGGKGRADGGQSADRLERSAVRGDDIAGARAWNDGLGENAAIGQTAVGVACAKIAVNRLAEERNEPLDLAVVGRMGHARWRVKFVGGRDGEGRRLAG
jgi:hypothetical protein